jgi:arylsulfatase A-like enzyme
MERRKKNHKLQPKKISRRGFLNGTASLIAGFSLAGCGKQLHLNKTTSKRPNIIFLLTDDQRWDTIGYTGNSIIQTPNMNRLASQGVTFTNAFVTTSICSCSRASIFSGQYTSRHKIYDLKTSFSQKAFKKTYPAILKEAGYRLGFVGKHGVGRKFPSETFDVWHGIDGQPKYEHVDENGNYKHMTQIMGEQSIDFLQTCDKDQPFCLSVSFKAPHVQDGDPRQFIYDPAYKDLYKDDHIPVPKTADDHYFEMLPKFLQKSEGRKRWQMRFSTPEKYQQSVKNYYRLITGIDVVIGKIRKELKKLDLDDNTVIILNGDNGFYLSEHGLAGKWFPHEESLRVPLVVFDPRADKKTRGTKPEQMVLNLDITPTILELAGTDIPDTMQGKSLMPLIKGQNPKWRTDFYYEHLLDYKPIPKSEAVRTKRYKYIRYFEQQPVYEELYDLKNDPYEIKNLVHDPDYKHILRSLQNRCDQLSKEVK